MANEDPFGASAWSDIPLKEVTALKDTLNLFNLNSGYQLDVPVDQLHDMAKENVTDLRHFEIYVWDHTNLTDTQRQSMPWLGVGMTQNEYDAKVREYAHEYKRMTGEDADPFGHMSIKNGYITDPVFQKIWDAMRTDTTPQEFALNLSEDPAAVAKNPGLTQGLDIFQTRQKQSNLNGIYKELTGQEAPADLLNKSTTLDTAAFRTNLIQDKTLTDTYGWLKYGKNYDQFQQYKTDSRHTYGTDLTDQQAITTLAENHAAGHILGAYQTAVLAPQQGATRQQDIPGVQSSEVH